MKKFIAFILALFMLVGISGSFNIMALDSNVFYQRVDKKTDLKEGDSFLIGSNSGYIVESFNNRALNATKYPITENKVMYSKDMLLFTVKSKSDDIITFGPTNSKDEVVYRLKKTDLFKSLGENVDNRNTWRLAESENGLGLINTEAKGNDTLRELARSDSTFKNYIPDEKYEAATIFKEVKDDGIISASFNTSGVIFNSEKVKTIESKPEESSLNLVLPSEGDIITNNLYLSFKGWSDGNNTYPGGDSVSISNDVVFTALYDAKQDLTVKEANLLAKSIGNITNGFKYGVNGVVSKIESNKFIIKDNNSSDELAVYSDKDITDLKIGSMVNAIGEIENHLDKKPQIKNATWTYLNEVDFSSVKCKASLAITYNASSLMPTKVKLRFGGIIPDSLYDSEAEYGVLASFEGIDPAKIDLAYIEEQKSLNRAIACPNLAKVEGGYQYAWVITNMEGHYDTKLSSALYMIKNNEVFISEAKNDISVIDICNIYKNDENLKELIPLFNNIIEGAGK